MLTKFEAATGDAVFGVSVRLKNVEQRLRTRLPDTLPLTRPLSARPRVPQRTREPDNDSIVSGRPMARVSRVVSSDASQDDLVETLIDVVSA